MTPPLPNADDRQKACALLVKYQVPLLTENDWKLMPPRVISDVVARYTADE